MTNFGRLRRLGVPFFLVAPFVVACGGASAVLPGVDDGGPLGGDGALDGIADDGSAKGHASGDGAAAGDAGTQDAAGIDGGSTGVNGGDASTIDATAIDAAADAPTMGTTTDATTVDAPGSDGSPAPSDAASDHPMPADSGSDAGCVPESLARTCANTACGPVQNNCGQMVTCPDTCRGPNTCGGGAAGPNACGCGGGAGQACCPGRTCAPGLVCSGGMCGPCGASNGPCCPVGPACAAGLTCNGDVCNACLAPLPVPSTCMAVPIVRATASNSAVDSDPQLAADGNRCTEWNAGDGPPQSWAGYYACPDGSCPNVTRVGLVPAMAQAGSVTFSIQSFVLGLGFTDVYGPATAMMQDNSYYEFNLDAMALASLTPAGAIRIRVIDGAAPVSFREVVFIACH